MSIDNYRGNGIAMRIPGGKGSIQRPTNYRNYDENYEKIFGDKKSRARRKATIEAQNLKEALEEADREDLY